MRYQPHLDGLRALAALAVVAFHARAPGFLGGYVGVDLFFVLSGYLITRLLAENSNIPRFYARRARRLLPALLFFLAVYLLVFPFLVPGHPHVRDAALAALYVSDYTASFTGAPKYLVHTWSLSVETHFYLLWPLILIKLNPGIRTLVVAYILATAWRWWWPDWFEAYTRFDTHATGLILGCIIAKIRDVPRFPAWLGIAILAVACFHFRWLSPDIKTWGWVIVELGAAVAILGTPASWLSSAPIVYIGRLSYGLYLWHYPTSRLLREWGEPWWVVLIASLLIGLVMAAVSYHTVEAWFRRRRVMSAGAAPETS